MGGIKKDRVLKRQDVMVTGPVKAEMLDLSEKGMYIYTGAVFIPGEIIRVGFTVWDERMEVAAKVRHVEKGVGLGVEFVELSPEDSEKIRRYVAGLRGQ